MGKYNCTQLHPEKEFENHVFHRDQFAHYLRWSHVLKLLKRDMNIMDLGCGSASLLEVIYRNQLKSNKYLGVEYRKKQVSNNKEKYKNLNWADFIQQDLTLSDFHYGKDWDIICSFEVIEHIGRDNVSAFLNNIKKHCNDKTIVLLSTPCYDEKVGAAKNHIINGVVGELTYQEMKDELVKCGFNIVENYGTFASIKDYEHVMNSWQKQFFNFAKNYFDTNILSNVMAPMFPEQSRNVLWKCVINTNDTGLF